jgi:succinyl-diaminopimelate desuccinylase
MSNTLNYAKELIRRPSVTPDDAGCQQWLADKLTAMGFICEHLRFGEVDNLWARRGKTGPLFVFAGHTDVVPAGNEDHWQHPPFTPTTVGDLLYGRGAADMKGSIAAWLAACETLVAKGKHRGSLGILITSDEEGVAVNGTMKVIEVLAARGELPDFCLVGEPSSSNQVGDVIKHGRRGSLNARLVVHGKQGHVAYPQKAENPVHLAAPALAELTRVEWDRGNDSFPATSFQISNIRAGTGTVNVIPGECEILFNFRFSTEVTAAQLEERTTAVLDHHGLRYDIDWALSGEPFLTRNGKLLEAARSAILEITGINTETSTSGGTSDGRFIAPRGVEVIELGPVNATIHQVDENTSIRELDQLTQIYLAMMEQLIR